jgi:MoaA/NifB/PqqE/SkfB family radical SAM enzyme
MASVHGGSETTSTARRHQLRAPRSVNGGNGFVFIDHLGNICPSGFLPAPRGNIGSSDLATVYRTDEMFVRLRDANALSGKRGRPLPVSRDLWLFPVSPMPRPEP